MKTETVIVLVVAAGAAVYFISRNKAAAAPRAYSPSGSIGSIGAGTHVPVSNTGVALASILGKGIQSWFGGGASSPGGIAPDANTPASLGLQTAWNPVYPTPSILPYSYKQQVIDTPSILNTDSVFTPPSDLNSNFFGAGGSSGSYSDQGTQSDSLGSASYI